MRYDIYFFIIAIFLYGFSYGELMRKGNTVSSDF